LYFVNNIDEIQQAYPDQKVYCYFTFVGRKNYVSDCSNTKKKTPKASRAFRQSNLGYKNAPVPSRMGANLSDSRHIERVATIVNLADRLCQEGRMEEALCTYNEAIRLHPNIEAIQYKRASCLLRLGRIVEAKAAIKYEAEHGKDPFMAKKMLKKMQKAEFNYRVKSFFVGVDDDLKWVDRFELSLEIAVIYITERCNSRCITCTSWQNRQDCELDTKSWISILKDIRQLGISSVAFTGGEPLLRRDLPQLVATSKDLGFSTIIICTNGLDLKQQRLNELEQCGANSFQVSLDGLKDNYKFIRGVDGYNKAMRAIEMIADRKLSLAVLSILMRQNIDDLERIAEIAAGHGAIWFVNLLENKKYLFKGVNIDPMLITNQTEIGRTIEILRSIKSKYADTCAYNEADIDYIRGYLENPGREANIPCTVGWHSIYFDPAGNLCSGCMSLPPVSSAVDISVSEVVSSPAMKKHLKAMIQRKCKGCTCGYQQRAALFAGNG
jgi:MoaA/NifB/PqqE/SkfB family radical SAM enzyme